MGKVWFCNIQPLRTKTEYCDRMSLVRGKLLWAPGPTVVETEAPLPSRNKSQQALLSVCSAVDAALTSEPSSDRSGDGESRRPPMRGINGSLSSSSECGDGERRFEPTGGSMGKPGAGMTSEVGRNGAEASSWATCHKSRPQSRPPVDAMLLDRGPGI